MTNNAESIFKHRLVMAPMSRGTDLPFRRLVAEWGCNVSYGEMAYAHKVVRGAKGELALVRRTEHEKIFGVQLAGKKPEVLAEAAKIAADNGADFVDVNLGCPIRDAVQRGFGASLLRRASRVATIVETMKEAVPIPITIKLRLGWSDEKPTFLKVARAASEAGVDAIALHARSRNQRYRRAADWSAVRELKESVDCPVIGNGDIMSWCDVDRRIDETGCDSVMIGRWALSKPWIFREYETQQTIEPTVDERLAILRRYVELCFESFGDDEWGRRQTRRFLGFHQDFFYRYRPGADADAVNSSDPRDWGRDAENELEGWLIRNDLDAVNALCDWLVDGIETEPPPRPPDGGQRAVKTLAYG